MLEGLEVSEVPLQDVLHDNLSFRLDAEFFKKRYVVEELLYKKLNAKKLVSLTEKIDVGFVGSMVPEYQASGIKLLQTKNIDAYFINQEGMKFISDSFNKELNKSQIFFEDILIARSGSFGKASIFLENEIYNSSDIIIVRANKKEINPYYLVSYLNSKLGINQLVKFASGGLQGHVNLTILENLKVPIIGADVQEKLEEVIKLAYKQMIASYEAYENAEIILLSKIGLEKWKPTSKNNNEKKFSVSFLQTGRLDAEYYQAKFDELEAAIKSNSYKQIRDIRTDNYRGLQPIYFAEGTLDVINSKHILEKNLDYEGFEKTSNEYWNLQERARVFKGDILIYTTGANIGRTQVYQIDKKAIASNHVNILRLKEGNPFYVGFVMNSIVGRMQTDKFSAGSAQAELYPKDVDEFLIPMIDSDSQKVIISLLEKSHLLQKESKSLLEITKSTVELAIENNEVAALKFINESV